MQLHNERISQLLQAKKMSYQQLADITHLSKATIHRYCKGVTDKIPIERIWAIAFALDTTPQYLMGDTDNPLPAEIGHNAAQPLFNRDNDTLAKLVLRCKNSESFANLIDTLISIKDENIRPVTALVNALKDE